MASFPYFLISPTALIALISIYKGPDPTVPTKSSFWKEAKLDVVIPAYNEEKNIIMCLAALERQTFPIRKVTIYDDLSTDNTVKYVSEYLKNSPLTVELKKRKVHTGKTKSIFQACLSDADAVMVLDADTFILDKDYIKCLMKELYSNASVATATGFVYPMHENNFQAFKTKSKRLNQFYKAHPESSYDYNRSLWRRFAKSISNAYRDISYRFLENFIYRGQASHCGSIPNTVGCASIYRRDRLYDVFKTYTPTLGFNLTYAEDTFIGFALINQGYRNALTNKVHARTNEPEIQNLPKQVFIWSSGFVQSCYYFNHLLIKVYKHINVHRRNTGNAKFRERRKIKEQYRQSWGEKYTLKHGRPISIYIFTSLIEKILFPLFIIFSVAFKNWDVLMITLGAESILVGLVTVWTEKGWKRIKTFLKSILIAPIRYMVLFVDLFVILKFIKDIVFNTKESWKK